MFTPRTTFPDYRVLLAHFKGHQRAALRRMDELSPQINVVLELRDSRAPISSANLLLDNTFRSKDKIILYTKTDRFSLPNALLQSWHAPRNETFLSIDTNKKSHVTKVLKLLKSKHNAMYPQPPLGLRIMIVGMPNVGKSTLVNQLRKNGLFSDSSNFRKVARTGNTPGVTRKTSEIIRICSDPEMLLYDTPGVTLPHANDIKTVLSLYHIGSLNHTEIDPIIACDYLLYIANLSNLKFFKKYISQPTNDVYELLTAVSKKCKNASGGRNPQSKLWKPNLVGSAITLIHEFQMGKLGKLCMDEQVITGMSSNSFNDSIQLEKSRVEDMIHNKPSKPSKRDRLVKQSNQLFV